MTELILNPYQIWGVIMAAEEKVNFVRPRKHTALLLQTQLIYTRFNDVMAVTSKLTVFWNERPYSLI